MSNVRGPIELVGPLTLHASDGSRQRCDLPLRGIIGAVAVSRFGKAEDGHRSVVFLAAYFLESARLGFGHWTSERIDLATRLWGDRQVARYVTRAGVMTESEIAARLAREVENDQKHGLQYWPLFIKADDSFVGCCGLRPYDFDRGIAEIGVHLLPEAWGKGYAQEAARTVIGYAFDELRLRAVFAGHNPNNTASAALLQKLGFVRTGEEFYEPTGLWHPSYLLQRGK
jgi:RimJ/RimL family protein N-acetyltransferase